MSTTTTSTASTGLDAMIMGNVVLMLTRPARLDNNTTRGAAPIPACLKPNLHAVFVVARVCSEWNRACCSNALWQIIFIRTAYSGLLLFISQLEFQPTPQQYPGNFSSTGCFRKIDALST
ncbi:hypothetical protein Pelo_16858 [Pelomyxa schiedti]|nr:hypothetical protein Pelo_16858 [Pelomyxa schiedti]